MPYQAPDYWTELHRRDDTTAVGQSTLPVEINRWLYRILASNLSRLLRRHGVLSPAPVRMFDVGAGRGDWVEFWRKRGMARIDGCDLVDRAVERLNERFGDTGTFIVADLGADAGPVAPSPDYPLVSVFNVLLHITDEDRFTRALHQVADLVEPGGWLVLVEPMLFDARYVRPYDPTASSRARPLEAYERALLAAGLERIHVGPAMVLANNPIEAGSRKALRRYQKAWNWMAAQVRTNPASARWLGPWLLVADRIGMTTGAAPSSKLAIYRRPIR